METQKIEQQKNMPQTVEEAVRMFVAEQNEDAAINYLKNHRENITEFCFQTYESFSKGDKTGIVLLARIIEKTL